MSKEYESIEEGLEYNNDGNIYWVKTRFRTIVDRDGYKTDIPIEELERTFIRVNESMEERINKLEEKTKDLSEIPK